VIALLLAGAALIAADQPLPVPEFRFTNEVSVLRRSTNLVDWHDLRIINTQRVEILYRDLGSTNGPPPARFFYEPELRSMPEKLQQ